MPDMSRDPKNDAGHGFSVLPKARKPEFTPEYLDALITTGIFAVQHLRLWPVWLNSMQLEKDA
jgi:hypothetical protein